MGKCCSSPVKVGGMYALPETVQEMHVSSVSEAVAEEEKGWGRMTEASRVPDAGPDALPNKPHLHLEHGGANGDDDDDALATELETNKNLEMLPSSPELQSTLVWDHKIDTASSMPYIPRMTDFLANIAETAGDDLPFFTARSELMSQSQVQQRFQDQGSLADGDTSFANGTFAASDAFRSCRSFLRMPSSLHELQSTPFYTFTQVTRDSSILDNASDARFFSCRTTSEGSLCSSSMKQTASSSGVRFLRPGVVKGFHRANSYRASPGSGCLLNTERTVSSASLSAAARDGKIPPAVPTVSSPCPKERTIRVFNTAGVQMSGGSRVVKTQQQHRPRLESPCRQQIQSRPATRIVSTTNKLLNSRPSHNASYNRSQVGTFSAFSSPRVGKRRGAASVSTLSESPKSVAKSHAETINKEVRISPKNTSFTATPRTFFSVRSHPMGNSVRSCSSFIPDCTASIMSVGGLLEDDVCLPQLMEVPEEWTEGSVVPPKQHYVNNAISSQGKRDVEKEWGGVNETDKAQEIMVAPQAAVQEVDDTTLYFYSVMSNCASLGNDPIKECIQECHKEPAQPPYETEQVDFSLGVSREMSPKGGSISRGVDPTPCSTVSSSDHANPMSEGTSSNDSCGDDEGGVILGEQRGPR